MTKHFSLSLASALAIFMSPAMAHAQSADDEIIVTATRAEGGQARATYGGSVTTISAEDMETRRTRRVVDVLRDVPGISVNRSGGPAGLSQIRTRGSESNHTLVLIDGAEASDPYLGEFDFATLIADDVSRVEVLRGAQSALYGSDAIAGVVHYITLSGAERSGLSGRAEYGTNNSWDGAVRLGHVAGPLDFAVSAGYQTTDGEPNARGGRRDVGVSNGVLSGRFVWTLADNARIRAMGRYSETEGDENPQDFAVFGSPTYGFIVDGDGTYENRAALGMLRGELELLDGRWSHALTVQGVDAARESFSGGAPSSADEASRLKGSYETSLRFGGGDVEHTLTGALDVERERFQNTGPFINAQQALRREIENIGAVLQYDIAAWERIGLGIAVRHDDNDRFDDATTWRATASYLIANGTRLHAAGGTGIRNPTVTELFGFDPANFNGNRNLQPEQSRDWEIGIEQTLLDGRVRLDATYFDAKLEDEIYTVFSLPFFIATPANRTTESTRTGVELSADAELGAGWRVAAAYTHLDAEENNAEEVRRPESIASVNVAWRASDDRVGAALTVRYNGEMLDNNFTSTGGPRVLLPAFTLVNLSADMRIRDDVELYVRGENITDEEYEEVYTYRSPGSAFYVGLRAGF